MIRPAHKGNLHQIGDYAGGSLPSGNGAYYARLVQNLGSTGGYSEALSNAKNFAQYAQTRIRGYFCNTVFAPTISHNDWSRRYLQVNPGQAPPAKSIKSEASGADDSPEFTEGSPLRRDN
jgi:hypothetical protein